MTNNSRSRWVYTGLLALFLAATAVPAQAQNAVLTGRVVSEFQEPLEAAQVFIQELNAITTTNAAGNYTLTVAGERVRGQTVTLRVRRIGFQPDSRQITLSAGAQTLNFTLRQDATRLTEIVVTGVTAGTEMRKVPFSIAKVDAADTPVPAVNPLSQLQGKVPGANIVSASGRPGAQPAILLRGPTSINASGRGQDPLYIVDGVIINGGLPDINPMDIESVEVIKGASAASLYGARAGNGVIQITTKSARGAADGVRFTARTEYGLSDIEGDFGLARNHMLLMDETKTRFCIDAACARHIDWRAEAARINNIPGPVSGVPTPFPIDPGAATPAGPLRQRFQNEYWPGRNFNAVAQTVDPQPFTQNNLDMSGRFGQTSFYASLGHAQQGGAIRFLNGYERSSLRLNVDQQVGGNISIGVRTYYARSHEDGDFFEGGGRAFFRLTRVPSIVDVLQRDTLGRLYIRPNLQNSGSQNENPLYSLENWQRKIETDRFLGGLTTRYTPLTWMDLEGNFSYDMTRASGDFFMDRGYRTTTITPTFNEGQLSAFANTSDAFNASMNVTLRRNLGNDLQTRTSLRYLYEQQDFNNRSFSGTHLRVAGVRSAANAQENRSIGSSVVSIRQIGYFAGVNLEYLDRYIVDALIRRDGSSLFGADNRWSNFGRVSLAWRLSEEPFWFAPFINEFKLRGSYGTAGGRPAFTAQYETFTVTAGGVVPGLSGNRLLRPEKVFETEVGLDAELFNRFGLMVNYAVAEARDQILPVTLPSSAGFSTQWQNAGTLENKTWEAALTLPLISRRDLQWNTRLIYDRTRSMVTRLDVPPFNIGTGLQATESVFRIEEGKPFAMWTGRKFITKCSHLPAQFQPDCGPNGAFQANDEGFIVWVGEGNNWRQGVTHNLWQAQLPSCVGPTGTPLPTLVGHEACATAGGTVTAPWGRTVNWGTPLLIRGDDGLPLVLELGSALPKYRFGVSQNLTWRRFTAYALLDANMGQRVWNQGRHWSFLDYLNKDHDQAGKNVQTAKPIGYYWRGIDAGGLGGFYDILAPNSHFVEDASYAKLREATVSYRVGPVGGFGDWQVSVVGRNLFTITDYRGFDPEVGISGGQASSAAVNAIDAFTFPNLRTVTFGLSTTF